MITSGQKEMLRYRLYRSKNETCSSSAGSKEKKSTQCCGCSRCSILNLTATIHGQKSTVKRF